MHKKLGQFQKYIPFTDDVVFCTILSNPRLCKKLLETILNVKIARIEYPEGQKTISHTLNAKSVRLDVYVEDENHTVYDIEMQTTNNRNLRRRGRYYQSMLDLSVMKRGMDYKELKQSFVIFICPFDPFNKDEYIYRFTHRCTLSDGTEFDLDDGANIVFINASGHKGNVSDEFKNLMHMILTDQPSDEFTDELKDAVVAINNDEEWRREYMNLQMKYDEIHDAAKEEGIVEGKVLELYNLVADGLLSAEIAASRLGLSMEEFNAKLQEYQAK